MQSHEQPVEQANEPTSLSPREMAEAQLRSSTSAKVIHEAIRLHGAEELERRSQSLVWSGLAAGLTMGASMLAQGLLHARLPDVPWRELVSSLGFAAGFVFVTMARQQLFTETVLTVTVPVLHGSSRPRELLRYWPLVFVFNIVGTLLFAAAATLPGLFPPDAVHAFRELGLKAVEPGFAGVLLKAVMAGWLIALMAWMMPAALSARILVIVAVTWLIAASELSHVITGSVETGFAALTGAIGWGDYLLGFVLPALIGNMAGGIIFVALLNHAQVKDET